MKEIWKLTINQRSIITGKNVPFEYCITNTGNKRDQMQLARVISTFETKRGYMIDSISITREMVLLWSIIELVVELLAKLSVY